MDAQTTFDEHLTTLQGGTTPPHTYTPPHQHNPRPHYSHFFTVVTCCIIHSYCRAATPHVTHSCVVFTASTTPLHRATYSLHLSGILSPLFCYIFLVIFRRVAATAILQLVVAPPKPPDTNLWTMEHFLRAAPHSDDHQTPPTVTHNLGSCKT